MMRRILPKLTAVLALSALPMVAPAQYNRPDYEPQSTQQNPSLRANAEAQEAATLEQKLGHIVPGDLMFIDSEGNSVTFADVFADGKPIILQPAFYACPMLCQEISKGIAESVGVLDLPAEDYRVITVSFDPAEGTEIAAANKASSLKHAARPDMAESWLFLTGDQQNIDRLLDSIGYGVGYIEEAELWAHPDAVVILSPDGQITRYLRGTVFGSRTLSLSLVEASDNQIGSATQHFFLTCFRYDPAMGKYTPFARGLMRWAALLTVIVVAAGIGFFLLREKRLGHPSRQQAALA